MCFTGFWGRIEICAISIPDSFTSKNGYWIMNGTLELTPMLNTCVIFNTIRSSYFVKTIKYMGLSSPLQSLKIPFQPFGKMSKRLWRNTPTCSIQIMLLTFWQLTKLQSPTLWHSLSQHQGIICVTFGQTLKLVTSTSFVVKHMRPISNIWVKLGDFIMKDGVMLRCTQLVFVS